MRIAETQDYGFITDLTKRFGMAVHPFDNCVKAWAAYEGAKAVGCVVLRSDGKDYQLDLLAVDEAHQGKGIGSKLTDTLLKEAKRRGARKIYLITRHAKEFYTRIGFTEISEKNFPKGLLLCLHCSERKACSPNLLVKSLE